MTQTTPVIITILPHGKGDTVRHMFREGRISCVTFTSSSTVDNFRAMFPEEDLPGLTEDTAVACIGPITAETAKRHGLKVQIMPSEYTIEALTGAIVEYFSRE